MVQTRPYEFMVSYTPQREWIEKGGIKLWLAFFFIELGAGIFFIGSFFDSQWAMTAGWLVCGVLGGGLHLLFLGRPVRFWRMLVSSGWKTSWISRGLIFVTLFLVLALVNIILRLQSGPPSALLIAADVFGFLTIIYGGFAMNFVNGIPLWNTALLPALYTVGGLLGGAEITLGIAQGTGQANLGATPEEWIRILLIGFFFLIPIYLISARYTSLTGRVSVKYVLSKWAPLFWVGVVVLGMATPLAVLINSYLVGLESLPSALLYTAIACGLVGDLAMRYLILRCGLYSPLIPSTVYA